MKKYVLCLGTLVFAFFITQAGHSTSSPAPLLFILHNLGETNALLPVIDKLPEDSYRILAFGKALEKLKSPHAHEHLIKFHKSFEALEVNTPLSAEELIHLRRILKTPHVIVSGMASVAQAQVLNTYKPGSLKKVIYYDNFDPLWTCHGIKEYLKPFYETLRALEDYTLIIPGTSYIEGARTLEKFSASTILPLGQPSLETLEVLYIETDHGLLRQDLGISEDQPVILYAGGFDPQDIEQYRRDFETFVQGIGLLDNVTVLVTYHPKTDGSVERKIIQKYGFPSIRIIEKGAAPTPLLSTIATVVCCFKSTIGAQVAYMGKPVLYIADSYENFLINAGIAGLAKTPEEVTESIQKLLQNDNKLTKDFGESLGIPKNASEKIKETIFGMAQSQ